MNSDIVLSTLNARFIHASFGLRYLRANLGVYQERCVIREYIIKTDPKEIVSEILALNPRVVGFGVYIWNTRQTERVIRMLREERPELLIVVGGPEISYETETQSLFEVVDFVFKGESDFSFHNFIEGYFERGVLPSSKIVQAPLPDIQKIKLPYLEYTESDLKNRTIYVEASRGCPYKCEYCLSSLDVSVRNFDVEQFLTEMQSLIDRGCRQFKFVDRTFNLSPKISSRILGFFLERIELGLFLHFEMVPDRLPDELKDLIRQFPAGSLQFEIGVQTWNPQVAANVSRRQNYEKISENFRYLRAHTGVHTHADLIVGLPGETFESFRRGFNSLFELDPDEIQVGILKRLKGTPIVKKTELFTMVYSSEPPFQILRNRDLSADQIRVLDIFAEFWDLVSNSGRFPSLKFEVRERIEADGIFDFYFEMSQFLYAKFLRTHSIHLKDLNLALNEFLLNRGFPLVQAAPRVNHHQASAAFVPARQAFHQAATQSNRSEI